MQAQVLLLVGVSLAISSCQRHDLPLAPDFGRAVRNNIAAQKVHPYPAPDAPDAAPFDHSGARAVMGQERYRTDRVKEPQPPTTERLVSPSVVR